MRGIKLAIVLTLVFLAAVDGAALVTPAVTEARQTLSSHPAYEIFAYIGTSVPLNLRISDSSREGTSETQRSIWVGPAFSYGWHSILWRTDVPLARQQLTARTLNGRLVYCHPLTDLIWYPAEEVSEIADFAIITSVRIENSRPWPGSEVAFQRQTACGGS